MRKSLALCGLAGAASIAAAIPAYAADGPKSDRLICRAATKTLASRIRKPRRCRTEEQWRQEDEAAARKPETLRVVAPRVEGRKPRQ
jgi:hypothetical protein